MDENIEIRTTELAEISLTEDIIVQYSYNENVWMFIDLTDYGEVIILEHEDQDEYFLEDLEYKGMVLTVAEFNEFKRLLGLGEPNETGRTEAMQS